MAKAIASSYLEFLAEFGRKFIDAGPRFPEAFTHIDLGVTDFRHGVWEFQTAAAILAGQDIPGPFMAAAADFSPTAEEIELENHLVVKRRELIKQMHKGEAAAGILDGPFIQFLRQFYLFIQSNPEILDLILALLKINTK